MNQTNTTFLYAHNVQQNRQEQIIAMQNTLNEGLQKYNQLVKEIERRNKTLAGLQENLDKCDAEINNIQRMKQILFEGTDDTNTQLHACEENYDDAVMECAILQQMKQTRYRDVQLLKKRVDEIRKVRDEFDKFLMKEVDNLVADTKSLDQIRSKFAQAQLQKNQMEEKLHLALQDHKIIRQNEMEVIKQMEIEQAAQEHIEKMRKDEQLAKKALEREEQSRTRQLVADEREKLTRLEEQLNILKQKISGVTSIYELMPYFDEARDTNIFCKEKVDILIAHNNDVRQEINDLQNNLDAERNGKSHGGAENQLMSEMETVGLEGKELEVEQFRWETEKAKKDDEFITKLSTQLQRSLQNILMMVAASKVPANRDLDRTKSESVEDLVLRLIRGIRNIQEALEQTGLTSDQIEEKIEQMNHGHAQRVPTHASSGTQKSTNRNAQHVHPLAIKEHSEIKHTHDGRTSKKHDDEDSSLDL